MSAAFLTSNAYGKSRVRLVRVTRRPDRHDVQELRVDVRFEGDFEAAHAAGDNAKVLPTDTMKNTVYVLAKDNPVDDPEAFGQVLARHFLAGHAPLERVRVDLASRSWERLVVAGKPHHHAFRLASDETRTASVVATRSAVVVESGVDDLLVMKTTGSEFRGYTKDRYTTLREASDRIFETSIRATWSYSRLPSSFEPVWATVRETILRTFANHESRSVQHTLFAMGEAVLAAREEISAIHLVLPNKHCLLVDLSPFGLENPNEIFVPVDEPHGLIEATVARQAPAKSRAAR